MDEKTQDKKINLFETLGPTKTFFLGILATFLVGSSIGFYVLLFSGTDTTNTNTNKTTFTGTTTNTVTNTAPNQPSAAAPSTAVTVGEITSDDHVRGNLETAQVVIVEYSDTECPFCKRFHPTMQQVVEEYGEQVAWVYRHFPLDSLHSKARNEAEATECAAELGGNDGFWAFLDAIYEITPSNDGLDASQLPTLAASVGIDETAFNDCLTSGRHADKVEAHSQDATKAGGSGTPYSVAVGKDGTTVPINGAQPYTSVKSVIDSLL